MKLPTGLFMCMLISPLALSVPLSVPLSALLSEEDLSAPNHFFVTDQIHPFRDGTALVSASSSFGHRQLHLHPIVTVPDPPTVLTTTLLIARIHPSNQTVIWASAMTTVETIAGLTVDAEGNTYIVGNRQEALSSPKGTITAIKYSPGGMRLYERSYTPRNVTGHGMNIYPEFSLRGSTLLVEDGKGTLFDVGEELVVPGLVLRNIGPAKFAIVRVNKKTGAFVATRAMPQPRGRYSRVSDFAVLKAGKNAMRSVACFLYRGELLQDPFPKNLYVQCVTVRGKKKIVRRVLEESDLGLNGEDHLAVEDEVKNGRLPSLFVVHERVKGFEFGASDGESTARHTMVIDRLDGTTLENVDWRSGKKGGRVKPLIVKMPTPFFGTAFLLGRIIYLPKRRTIGVLFSTRTEITKFRKNSGPKADIVVKAKKAESSLPNNYWVLYIDKNIGFATTFISGDPGVKAERDVILKLDDMMVSQDEKTATLYGSVTSEFMARGPMRILNTNVPDTSMH